ncbi:MAG: carboxypeptidase-like regulatory domain-containing protein [Myxococcales bacterium]
MGRARLEAARSLARPSPTWMLLTRGPLGAGLRFGALAGLLLTSSCGADNEDVGEAGKISGIVRDEATGARLKNAHVIFTSDTLETADGHTDDDGEYDITVTSRSVNGRIEATKQGYLARTVSVFLDDKTVQIDVDLPRAQ